MKMPHNKSKSSKLLDLYGLFHEAQLLAEEKTQSLGENFSQVQEHLQTRWMARIVVGKKIPLAQAVQVRVARKLGLTLREFYRILLNELGGNKSHSRFKQYFPRGLKPYSGLLTSTDRGEIKKILTYLREEETGDWAQEFQEKLPQLWEEFEKALHQVEALEEQFQEAFVLERAAATTWREVYKQNEIQLLLIYEGNKVWVNSFFKNGQSTGKKKKTPKLKPERIDESVK